MSAKEKICPYCGKPAGEIALCTNCGAELYKRTTFKPTLLVAAVILAIGVASSYQAAFGGVSVMKVGELTEIHNYAYMWFEGTVSDGPRYRRIPSARLDFSIYDGNEISVRAYSEDAKALVRENRIPRVGDRVRFLGRARVEMGRKWIDVDNSQTKFELYRGQIVTAMIREVAENPAAYCYKAVRVVGVVVGEPIEYVTAYLYTLRDENYPAYTLSVYLHKGLWELTNYRPQLNVGSRLQVLGGINSRYQLVPSSLEDFQVIP